MNPALRRSAAHVFVETLDAPVLADEDRHHLVTVMRLRDGQPVSAGDGAGGWRSCRLMGGELVIDGEIVAEPAPAPPITIGFALPKGDRPEWIVQKLTEIGVDRIVLLHTERSIVRWEPAKVARQLERLHKVAREASMQSRRVRLPIIEGPLTPSALIAAGSPVAFAEPGGGVPSLGVPTVLVGPEGGWTDGELAGAAQTVSLGTTILRVETATLVAASRFVTLRDS
ncbi:MAG: rsmE [Ilumatobacteraceae bacterium]|nr:rsmE [Ilumatobacteraceae bacterium]